jgi:hypothetical protein
MPRIRSCRRLEKSVQWSYWLDLDYPWSNYSEKRLKNTFRVSRQIFPTILHKIGNRTGWRKKITTELPVSFFVSFFASLFFSVSFFPLRVHKIVIEVCEVMVTHLWHDYVYCYFPLTEGHTS